jgi:hypothetical protein
VASADAGQLKNMDEWQMAALGIVAGLFFAYFIAYMTYLILAATQATITRA